MEKQILKSTFPSLSEIELIEEIAEFGIEKEFFAGETLMRKGQYMNFMPLIVSGAIKVMRENEEGNEVLLYFLEGGNSCAMSITCCMQATKSSIRAIVEETSTVILIPIEYTNKWMTKYQSWRNFILMSYSHRMEELLFALDSIAFHKLDERLLEYLKKRSKATKSNTLHLTHGEIATELNSSREAISRLLKKLESMKKVALARNKITLMM